MIKVLEQLRRNLRLMIGRGVVLLVDDTRAMQMVQVEVLAGETREMERFQDYGFTSVPKDGAEHIVGAVGGQRDHLVALRIDDRRYRLKNLKSGEVALYDDLGNMIVFERDQMRVEAVQHLDVTAPTCNITATTTHDGNVTINGNLTVNGVTLTNGLGVTGTAGSTYMNGDVDITGGDITVDGISSKHHKHQENDVNGLTGEAQ